MSPDAIEIFPGFPDFRANVTFTPIQFFTVVVPHSSRGTVRIVGYALRKVLGWVDEEGNPTREQLRMTYRELIDGAGVSRDCIAEALREAIEKWFLRCIQAPRPDQDGQPAQSGIYELCWDKDGRYTDNPTAFRGFFFPEAAVMEFQEGARTVQRPKAARKNIPNAFFDYLLPRERLSVMWHNFILYTMDYDEFCRTRLGIFVHHRPRRRDDPKSARNMRQETLDFAGELFGTLPTNFQYTHAEMFKASNDCVNSCSHSAPSTNCQS